MIITTPIDDNHNHDTTTSNNDRGLVANNSVLCVFVV